MLDVFINVAAHIARKGKLEVIGKSVSEIKELTDIKPVINKDKNQILGSVIYIDNYGNLVTSIKESLSMKLVNQKFYNFCKKCKV